MTDLERLRRKQPAVVRSTDYRMPTYVKTVVGTQRQVAREVRWHSRAGLLSDTGERRLITRGARAGQYELQLILLDRAPRSAPRWAKLCLYAGWVLLTLAALVGALAWLVASLSAAALATFLVFVLVAFLAWLRARFGGRGITVTQVVNIR